MIPSEKKEAFVELLLAGDSMDESKMDAAFQGVKPEGQGDALDWPSPPPSRDG